MSTRVVDGKDVENIEDGEDVGDIDGEALL